LYKVFDENRKYVTLDKISQNMQNAIVATEDKNFWTNPGIDVK
jgi:membrane peptidoglycan carboxypeptidase